MILCAWKVRNLFTCHTKDGKTEVDNRQYCGALQVQFPCHIFCVYSNISSYCESYILLDHEQKVPWRTRAEVVHVPAYLLSNSSELYLTSSLYSNIASSMWMYFVYWSFQHRIKPHEWTAGIYHFIFNLTGNKTMLNSAMNHIFTDDALDQGPTF